MRTFDVTLPSTKKVIFPPRCVVCETKNPDGIIELSFLGITTAPVLAIATDQAIGLDVDPKYYSSNTSKNIQGIPACKGCVSGLKWYHRRLQFGYYTGWIPGIILLLLGIPAFISITIVILGAMSPGILTLIFPPSFGASFWNDKANFEFKSKTTAEEFSQLNESGKLEINNENV